MCWTRHEQVSKEILTKLRQKQETEGKVTLRDITKLSDSTKNRGKVIRSKKTTSLRKRGNRCLLIFSTKSWKKTPSTMNKYSIRTGKNESSPPLLRKKNESLFTTNQNNIMDWVDFCVFWRTVLSLFFFNVDSVW